MFLANFDSVTAHQNLLDRILRTRYLRLFPRKWHKYIALRAEVLGCYEPYRKFFIEAFYHFCHSNRCIKTEFYSHPCIVESSSFSALLLVVMHIIPDMFKLMCFPKLASLWNSYNG